MGLSCPPDVLISCLGTHHITACVWMLIYVCLFFDCVNMYIAQFLLLKREERSSANVRLLSAQCFACTCCVHLAAVYPLRFCVAYVSPCHACRGVMPAGPCDGDVRLVSVQRTT